MGWGGTQDPGSAGDGVGPRTHRGGMTSHQPPFDLPKHNPTTTSKTSQDANPLQRPKPPQTQPHYSVQNLPRHKPTTASKTLHHELCGISPPSHTPC